MVQRITCPRRMAEFGPWKRAEGLDRFESGHGLVRQALGCSFCGSMEPGNVLELLENGAELEPTDKNYKVYVQKDGITGKFYFQHFSEEQKNRFIELHNQKPRPFTIGYPGYLYVLPFFAE